MLFDTLTHGAGSTSPTTSTGGILSTATSGLFGTVTNFLGNTFNFSGPTGAARVDFKNDRNKGTEVFFYGKTITAKYRDMDYVVKRMGASGLTQFGSEWAGNEVPRQATGAFKRAENFFFENLPLYLQKVKDGTEQLPENFLNDAPVTTYLEMLTPFSITESTAGGSTIGSFLSATGNEQSTGLFGGSDSTTNVWTVVLILGALMMLRKK